MSAGTTLAAAPWPRAWLDAYPCDMPSSVPYPHAPLSALLEHAARNFDQVHVLLDTIVPSLIRKIGNARLTSAHDILR